MVTREQRSHKRNWSLTLVHHHDQMLTPEPGTRGAGGKVTEVNEDANKTLKPWRPNLYKGSWYEWEAGKYRDFHEGSSRGLNPSTMTCVGANVSQQIYYTNNGWRPKQPLTPLLLTLPATSSLRIKWNGNWSAIFSLNFDTSNPCLIGLLLRCTGINDRLLS